MSLPGVLLAPEHHWTCPNCSATHVTREARPHTPFHSCRGLRGLTAPFVAAGTKAKVEAREREDYVGADRAAVDGEGRPVMSVVTTRDTGQDCAVLAPCATATSERE
ncbi:MAG: hypothetical protein EPO65_00660 [Dehalococcoidia bacterium]|nr:MAG: hypothetical protein EPO65_00660 [Dehalococcoidia bacterium]